MEDVRKLLPVGSVVLLQNGQKKLMIIGIKPVDTTNNAMYDYLAVPYPEGFVKDNLTFFVNHDKIDKVIARGYEDEEREDFINRLEEYYNNRYVTKFKSDQIKEINAQIIECNNSINEKYDNLKREISKLNSSWTGNAGAEAEKRFGDLETLKIKRAKQLKVLTDMLEKVKNGYIQTEQTNNSLSSRFK